MTVSLMIEESKRIVSQLLNNYRASDLNVVIETQDKNFLMESMVNTFSCLADWEINENSKVYVFRKGEDELRQDMEIKKAAMIQITFKAQEETKEEYYEEGFFGSKTSFNVSEQFKQSFKSILSEVDSNDVQRVLSSKSRTAGTSQVNRCISMTKEIQRLSLIYIIKGFIRTRIKINN